RNLHECEKMQRTEGVHGNAGADIGNGSGGVGKVRESPLVATLVSQVHLELGHPLWMRLVTQAEAHRLEVAGTIVVPGLIHPVADGALKLSVYKGVKILDDGLVVISADNDIRAACAGLEARVQRLASVGPAIKLDRGAVVPGGKLDPQLQPEVVSRKEALPAADEFDVA